VAPALALAVGCTTPRYIGSIGRDGTYSNRGYGMAILLASGGLAERWQPIDPSETDAAPKGARPTVVTAPLDIDGDGLLEVTERQLHAHPTLRLLSRTSTAARIDVEVGILGGKNAAAPLEALLFDAMRKVAKTSSAAAAGSVAGAVARTVSPDFDARVGEIETDRFYRIAVIDHGGFLAEEGIRRRQLVTVVLAAPSNAAAFTEDHDRVIGAMILNRRGSSTTIREQW
jgi:hypothetical protein